MLKSIITTIYNDELEQHALVSSCTDKCYAMIHNQTFLFLKNKGEYFGLNEQDVRAVFSYLSLSYNLMHSYNISILVSSRSLSHVRGRA